MDACKPLAVPNNAGKVCEVNVPVLHPQRVAKQALTSVLATSEAGVTARYPHLRELLLDAEATRPLAPLRLWLYLQATPGGRSSGVVASIMTATGVGRVLAEFAFWPLGWVLTFDDVAVNGAVEVSSWFEIGYHDKQPVVLAVPCQWVLTPNPADFRSSEAILEERARREGLTLEQLIERYGGGPK